MNKPVAWMNKQMDYIIHNNWKENTANPDAHYYTIPLYTHPVKEPMMVLDGNRVYPAFKELTDEEIISTMVQFDVYSNDDQCLIEAGKAILRKAQEK